MIPFFICIFSGALLLSSFFSCIAGEKEDGKNAVKLALVAVCVYVPFSLLAYGAFEETGKFLYPDEHYFSSTGMNFATYGFVGAIAECFTSARDQALGVFSYAVPYLFFGSKNGELLCYAIPITASAGIPPCAYLILRHVSDRQRAFRAALLYVFLGLGFYFSSHLLRDSQVAFITTLSILLYLRPFSLKNVFFFYGLTLIASGLRPENGILTGILLCFYLFFKSKRNSFRVPLLVLTSMFIFLAGVVFFPEISNRISEFATGAENYALSTAEGVAEGGGSLGKIVYGLPMGIRNVFIVINSLFPLLAIIGIVRNILSIPELKSLVSILPFLAAFIFLCILTLKTIPFLLKNYGKLHQDLKTLALYLLVFLGLNSFSMEQRRIFGIYVILLLFWEMTRNFLLDRRMQNNKKLLVPRI